MALFISLNELRGPRHHRAGDTPIHDRERRAGLREQIALQQIAAETHQRVTLGRSLDAFRNHHHAELAAQIDHGADELLLGGFAVDAAGERHVELHDLGLIAFALTLSRRGWRITYLGPDTPIESLVDTASRLSPELVVVSSTSKRRLTPLLEPLKALGRRTRVAVAGSGAADITEVQTLAGDPVAAALTV